MMEARGGEYGEELRIAGRLGAGPAMDVAVEGARAYVIGRGTLYVSDISDPGAPRIVGRLAGLGNTRQIVVRRGVAYITSREDGLFIVDVARPEQPRLLCHYDTIELATGVALSGNVLFVACRTYGVEIVDATDPQRPAHLSTVRTGEAQSVTARDGFLYAGVWGTSELVIVDVRNPRRPAIVARAPLDGFGDGVDVRGKFCYVATGHHSRAMPRKAPGDAGYGRGHGLEIFDISNPAAPVFLSRVKMPSFYSLGMDMWSVTVSGRYAFVADTFNGVFVVDVSNSKKPSFVAHKKLDRVEGRGEDFVGGLAVGRDCIYAAGGYSDLHVLEARDLAAPPELATDKAPVIPPFEPKTDPRFDVYRPDGQVYAVAVVDDTALVAAGGSGLHIVQLGPELKKLGEYATKGFAMDVKVLDDRVYVAEGTGGLSIWRREGQSQLVEIGRYRAEGATIKQVVVPPPGKYALLGVGANILQVVDVSAPSDVRCILRDSRLGLLYGDQIADGLLEGRYACAFWHVSGLYWYDLYGGPRPVYTGDNYGHRFDAQNGVALLAREALVVWRGKYFLLDRKETRPPEALPQYGVEGCDLSGKPCVFGDRLHLSNRFTGKVTVLDIADIRKPRLLASYELEGNPGRVGMHKGVVVIPAGYQGLLVCK